MAGAVGTSFPAAGAACGPGRVASAPGRVRRGPKGALSRRLSAPAATMTRTRASRWWQSSSGTLFAAAAVSVRFRVAGCVAPRAGAGRGGGPPSRPQHWPGPQDAARRGAPWATSETRRLGLRCPELPPSIDRASGRTPVRHVRVWGLGVRAGRTPRPAQWGARPLSGLRLLCVVGGGHVLRQPCGVKQTLASGALCPWGA